MNVMWLQRDIRTFVHIWRLFCDPANALCHLVFELLSSGALDVQFSLGAQQLLDQNAHFLLSIARRPLLEPVCCSLLRVKTPTV